MAFTQSSTEYDLIVIGSGPGGQRAAIQTAKLGKRALLIEKGDLGGGCLYTGTIPSKTLREAALHVHEKSPESQFQKVMQLLGKVIRDENSVIEDQLKRNKVDCVRGIASFIDANTIAVKTTQSTRQFEGLNVLIATGSRPIHPSDITFDEKTIFDSDTILKIKAFPKTLAVLGAGVIGSEYASIFANLGVKVTLIDRRNSVLRGIDDDISAQLVKQFANQKIEIILSGVLSDIKPGAEMKINGAVRKFDAILYCMGRTGNVEELNLSAAKVQQGERGILPVNGQYQTNISTIYAVGDVIGAPSLAASSSEQGRIAANFMFTNEKLEFPRTFPYGIYTIPEISNVGLQEMDLKREKIPYIVGRALYKELARGKILGDNHGLLKLLVHERTRKILGIHIIGSHATELIHIGQVVMALDGTIDFLVKNVFNYPTLAEAYKVAAYHAYNQLR